MKIGFLSVLALATVAQLGGCGGGGGDGVIRVSWAITVNGGAGECDEVGATTVRVIVREGGVVLDDPAFDCEDAGAELVIAPGTYEVQLDIFDAAARQLNLVPFVMTAIVRSNRTVILGTAEFTFELGISPSFTVQWGSTDETCSSAGIVHEEIRVSTGGACLDFDLLVGGTSAATCVRYVCEEGPVVRTLLDLPPDDYLIQVIGWKGATSAEPRACYYSEAVACSPAGCPTRITALFDPLPEDEQFCNATKPQEPDTR